MGKSHGIDMEAGAAEASIEHNEKGKISLFLFCHEYCKDYRKQMPLREFLTALNITAEDCQKAFDEVEDDDALRCFYCNEKLLDDEVKTYHDEQTCNACHYLLVEYAKSAETEATDAE